MLVVAPVISRRHGHDPPTRPRSLLPVAESRGRGVAWGGIIIIRTCTAARRVRRRRGSGRCSALSRLGILWPLPDPQGLELLPENGLS